MYLKCRHSGVHFLVLIVAFPCCLSYFEAIHKKRTNIEDYGERLSSIERGRRGSSSGLNRENKEPLKSGGGNDHKDEDEAQEEGISLQDIPVVRLETQKSSSKQALSKGEDNVSQKDPNNVSPEEKSKKQENEEKLLKSEENSKERGLDKTLKSEDNDVSRDEKQPENESKLDLTDEQESNTTKQNDDKANLDEESPTKCTTDKEIRIGDYTPQESHSNDEGHTNGESHAEDSGGGAGGGGDETEGGNDKSSKDATDEGKNYIDEETGKTVSKVYKGPKPAKAPDHYIDDI